MGIWKFAVSHHQCSINHSQNPPNSPRSKPPRKEKKIQTPLSCSEALNDVNINLSSINLKWKHFCLSCFCQTYKRSCNFWFLISCTCGVDGVTCLMVLTWIKKRKYIIEFFNNRGMCQLVWRPRQWWRIILFSNTKKEDPTKEYQKKNKL